MYKRVLLKLSGEALKGKSADILDSESLKMVAGCIKELVDAGIQVAVVNGAGNVWRGKIADRIGLDRVPADYMGMMGTVINSAAIKGALKNVGVPASVFSAIPCPVDLALAYSPNKAINALEHGQVVLLSGGLGLPYFTTDTASVTRAIETKCDAILMGKNGVKGVYDKDPNKYSDAKFLPEVTFQEMEEMNIEIMDASAIEMVKRTDLQIMVFSMSEASNFSRAARGENVGTICKKEK